MMQFNSKQILTMLEKLRPPEGGYSKDPEIAKLQAHLSILLEVAYRREESAPKEEEEE